MWDLVGLGQKVVFYTRVPGVFRNFQVCWGWKGSMFQVILIRQHEFVYCFYSWDWNGSTRYEQIQHTRNWKQPCHWQKPCCRFITANLPRYKVIINTFSPILGSDIKGPKNGQRNQNHSCVIGWKFPQVRHTKTLANWYHSKINWYLLSEVKMRDKQILLQFFLLLTRTPSEKKNKTTLCVAESVAPDWQIPFSKGTRVIW